LKPPVPLPPPANCLIAAIWTQIFSPLLRRPFTVQSLAVELVVVVLSLFLGTFPFFFLPAAASPVVSKRRLFPGHAPPFSHQVIPPGKGAGALGFFIPLPSHRPPFSFFCLDRSPIFPCVLEVREPTLRFAFPFPFSSCPPVRTSCEWFPSEESTAFMVVVQRRPGNPS